MTSTAGTTDRDHPIAVALARIEDELKSLRDVPAWSLGAEQTRAALARATRATARVAEVEARLAAHGRTVRVEDASGATSTANWWAHTTKQTRAGAHRKTRLATALARPLHEPVRVALADGRLLVDQAQVIVEAVDALPDDLVSEDLRARAQQTLIGYAAEHDAKGLRILGRRILDVIAPEVGEAHEARLLEKQENDAQAAAVFRISDDGHGKTHGRFTIPTAVAEQLRKALRGLAAPRHRAAAHGRAPDPDRPGPHRMGQAFCEYITGYPTDRLPNAGGMSATVVVTMELGTLLGGLAAQLDTGTRISPTLARRWACEAGIIPAVLGSDGQVLDLGRTKRFHTKAQRIALGIEQGGCTADGCDWPPGMCHVHHDVPWSRGGPTDMRNGRLLCPRHHARAHDTSYTLTHRPGGKVRFHRRT